MTYNINNKVWALKDDFTFKGLEWLDVVMGRLNVKRETEEVKGNEVNGSFTRDEIEKTLQIILIQTPLNPPLSKGGKEEGSGFEHEDFMECTEGIAVKIIADFFLQKAIQGAIINRFSMN